MHPWQTSLINDSILHGAPEFFPLVFQPAFLTDWGWHVKMNGSGLCFLVQALHGADRDEQGDCVISPGLDPFFHFLPLLECAYIRTVFTASDENNSNRLKQQQKDLIGLYK